MTDETDVATLRALNRAIGEGDWVLNNALIEYRSQCGYSVADYQLRWGDGTPVTAEIQKFILEGS